MSIRKTLERLKSGPHWRVVMHPGVFQEERVQHNELVPTLESAQVRLRGGSFPSIPRDSSQLEREVDSVGFSVDSPPYLEAWRLFQSLQFVSRFGVREYHDHDWRSRLTRSVEPYRPADGEPVPGCFSLKNFTWTILETFEFARRLYASADGVTDVHIEIEINGAKGFDLATDADRVWFGGYRLGTDHLPRVVDTSVSDLVDRASELAIDTVIWMFHRFGWERVNAEMIRKDVRELIR